MEPIHTAGWYVERASALACRECGEAIFSCEQLKEFPAGYYPPHKCVTCSFRRDPARAKAKGIRR